MEKESLLRNDQFRNKCKMFGLKYQNIELLDGVIILENISGSLNILLDQNYNTIAVEKKNSSELSKIEYIQNIINQYKTVSEEKKFDYPFENFTLKNIIDLANRIKITNDQIEINGKCYSFSSKAEHQFHLLSYIKFLGESIELYFRETFHLHSIGMEIPSVYTYLQTLIKKINAYINLGFTENQMINPIECLRFLGLSNPDERMIDIFLGITILLKKEKIENENLSVLAIRLLSKFTTSDKEFYERLYAYLDEDIEETPFRRDLTKSE